MKRHDIGKNLAAAFRKTGEKPDGRGQAWGDGEKTRIRLEVMTQRLAKNAKRLGV